MQHIITKFGGTSVSSRVMWDQIAAITKKHIKQGFQPVVVCSALTQVSNKLENAIAAALLNQHQTILDDITQGYYTLANELNVDIQLIAKELAELNQWLTGIALLKESPAKTRAQILSLGELMMTRLGHEFLNNCSWFDVREALTSIPVPHDDSINYLAGRCSGDAQNDLAQRLLNSGAQAIITQGFIAAHPNGDTVLLGRGGSDTSGALLASCLQAVACEIWTDVPGIYSANPHLLPHARLLKQLNYDEAQEIASMGAKVLHPNCIPPVRNRNIPMFVKWTRMPEHSGTRISHDADEKALPIKSIQVKHQVTLISIDTLHMWQQVGFLADVFAAFKAHGFSIDLLSSSEFNVTVSLDSNAKLRNQQAINDLLAELNGFGRARIINNCSAVSLVGHRIRTVLPELGPMLEIFDGRQVYLMSLASNDLNLSFVVDESDADILCQKLHALLIENNPQSFYYSKSWQEEFGTPVASVTPWWKPQREALLALAEKNSPCYVYDSATQERQAEALLNLEAIDQVFYAIKANSNSQILNTLYDKGINFECVSIQELQHVLTLFADINPQRLLFTPNFAPKEEYEFALARACYVTIDNIYPLIHWPELFTGKSILLRIDPGSGAGHHKYVRTGGNKSKFGIPQGELDEVLALIKQHQIKVIGLHAHSGSGILSPDLWQKTAVQLTTLAAQFPDVKIINLGGGLGIVEKPSQQALDLNAVDASLMPIKTQFAHLQFWLEPGRFFVAESGVILAKVTQCKGKGDTRYIGIETGMNSLMRPALYGAYHEIVNLTRLHQENTGLYDIVGPICESGDTLGYDRMLPETVEGDVILIANTGAYGFCMSSNYNLRPAAQEIIMSQK